MRDGSGGDTHLLITVLSFEFEVLSFPDNLELSTQNSQLLEAYESGTLLGAWWTG